MSTGKARRKRRLDALGDHQRMLLLSYLSGAVPETVDAALDFAEGFPDGGSDARMQEDDG